MIRALLIAIVLLPAPSLAQDETVYLSPRIPDEAEKSCALQRAYVMNGNSMNRTGSIDLTDVCQPHVEKSDKAATTIKPKSTQRGPK